MRVSSIINTITILLFSVCYVSAQKIKLSNKNAEYCTGMYSKIDWGGPIEPFIKVDLRSYISGSATRNASVSLIVFEYQDVHELGVVEIGRASCRERV